MNIESVIVALADAYTVERLRELRAEALEKLASGEIFTSVSAGGGVSFVKQQVMKLEDWLDALQGAIFKAEGKEEAVGACVGFKQVNSYL